MRCARGRRLTSSSRGIVCFNLQPVWTTPFHTVDSPLDLHSSSSSSSSANSRSTAACSRCRPSGANERGVAASLVRVAALSHRARLASKCSTPVFFSSVSRALSKEVDGRLVGTVVIVIGRDRPRREFAYVHQTRSMVPCGRSGNIERHTFGPWRFLMLSVVHRSTPIEPYAIDAVAVHTADS
jgi:hypothetical protein